MILGSGVAELASTGNRHDFRYGSNNCPRDELERSQLNPQQRTCDDCFGMSEKCQ